jgi:hypothetical protein
VDTGENRPMAEREASTEVMNDAPCRQIFRIIKGFYRSKQNHYIYFSLQAGILKIQKPTTHGHEVLIKFDRH